jgi:hypothetical protein
LAATVHQGGFEELQMPSVRNARAAAQDKRVPPSASPLHEMMQFQIRCLEQGLELQTAWWTACAPLLGACWRPDSSGNLELPAWMVWHNGCEQLA